MTDTLALCRAVLEYDATATPGPWFENQSGGVGGGVEPDYEHVGAVDWFFRDLNLALHYRTAAPVLAREVSRLTAERDALRAEVVLLEEQLESIECDCGVRAWGLVYSRQVTP